MPNIPRSLACALGLLLAAAAPAAPPQWVEQGPGPILQGQTEGLPDNPVSGSVNAIAIDLAHPGTVYAGTTNGGVWRTTGANAADPAWVPLTDQQLPGLSINSIAISPLDAGTIFAGTGSTSSYGFEGSPGFGVARSTDGGTSWSVLAGATFAGRRIDSIVPTASTSGGLAGQVVLAATLFDGGGVYRSADGGTNFTRVSGTAGLPDGGASSLVGDPGAPLRLYAAVPAGSGAGAAAGVFRSDDAGLSWNAVNSGLSGLDSSSRILLAVGRGTGVVYAMVIDGAGSLGGVFRSANQGASWSAMGAPAPVIFPGQQGAVWHGAIAADPVDANIVYVSGDRQDLPNPNGCNNYSANVFRGDVSLTSPWQNVVCSAAQGTSPHADSRAMGFDANGSLVQANDGGIYRLDNPKLSTRQWVSLNGNVRPTEIHSAAYDAVSHIVFGGTQDTGTPMQNAPGSLAWTDFLQGDGGVVAVDDTSTPGVSTRYSSYTGLSFFNRSTWNGANAMLGGLTVVGLQIVSGDGAGLNLLDYDANLQFYNPYVLNAVDPSRMLIGTASIYESHDRGDSLDNLGFTGKFISALAYGGRLNRALRPDAFYVGTSGGGAPYLLHRASAGGAVLELGTYPGNGVRALAMDPQDIRKVYVADEQGRVWASFNEGQSWINLTANLPSLLGQVRSIEVFSQDTSVRNTVLIVGGQGGAFQLRRPGAAGNAWLALSSGLPHGLVLNLHYNYTDDVLVAAVFGRGVWTLSKYFRGGGAASFHAAAVAAGRRGALALPAGIPKAAPRAQPRAGTAAALRKR